MRCAAAAGEEGSPDRRVSEEPEPLGLQATPAALGTLACSDINAASKRGMNFRKMFTSYFPSLKKTKLEEIVQFEQILATYKETMTVQVMKYEILGVP